jgi:short-subunit dehydrogenase
VTSAAHISPPANAIDLPTEEISKTFKTNLVGNANLAKEFLTGSSETGSGAEKVILDISSLAAHIWLPYTGAYSASKIAFTYWLAGVQQDMADKNVRIHSFHPGGVFTDSVKRFGLTEDSRPWDSAQLSGGFAVWLASKEASFLKGRYVWANWDVPELVQRKGEFESDPELLKMGLKGNPAS